MKIEIKGIVQYYDQGHKCVDVVVAEDEPYNYKRHRVAVDEHANRGMILMFLATMYDVKPSAIVWPRHIRVVVSDIEESPAL